MSTTQSMTHATPRFRIGLRVGLVALGLLIAVAVTAVIVALSGGSQTSGANTAAHYPPLIHYHGTGQADATRYLGIAQAHGGGTSATPVASRPAPATHLNCAFIRPEHRCVVR